MLLTMLGRLATYVVPVAAVLITVLVLLGPGSTRPALGARVLGLPVAGEKTLALRLEGVRRLHLLDDAAPLGEVLVEATDGPTPLPPAPSTIGRDGVGEVVLRADAPLAGPLLLRVRRGELVLAEGPLELRPEKPLPRGTGALSGAASGDLALRVVATRGQLAAPFPEEVRIEVAGTAGATIEASAPGAEITPDKVTTDAHGKALVTVKPLAHTVELTVSARAPDGRSGRWEGLLPVVPGAIWLDRSRPSAALVLVSPAPRDSAYLSFVDPAGRRLLGAIVPMARDAEGFHRGAFTLAGDAAARAAMLVVAPDAEERSESTVAWPLQPPEGALRPPALELLLDGVPDAEAREQSRAARARRAALGVVGASALFEILLLFFRSKRAQRELDEGLAEAVAAPADPGSGLEVPVPEADRKQILAAAREHPTLRVALAIALVLLAFAVVAAVSTFR